MKESLNLLYNLQNHLQQFCPRKTAKRRTIHKQMKESLNLRFPPPIPSYYFVKIN